MDEANFSQHFTCEHVPVGPHVFRCDPCNQSSVIHAKYDGGSYRDQRGKRIVPVTRNMDDTYTQHYDPSTYSCLGSIETSPVKKGPDPYDSSLMGDVAGNLHREITEVITEFRDSHGREPVAIALPSGIRGIMDDWSHACPDDIAGLTYLEDPCIDRIVAL